MEPRKPCRNSYKPILTGQHRLISNYLQRNWSSAQVNRLITVLTLVRIIRTMTLRRKIMPITILRAYTYTKIVELLKRHKSLKWTVDRYSSRRFKVAPSYDVLTLRNDIGDIVEDLGSSMMLCALF